MSSDRPLTADEVADYITSTFPDTKVARAMGATFFSLTEDAWPNFATIVTTDEHDMGEPSKLVARGAWRLNIGVGRDSSQAIARQAGQNHDYAAVDRLIPHPVYAKQRWVAIINPTRATFDSEVKTLLDEAYNRLATSASRRASGSA